MAAISTMRWSMSAAHGPQYSALVGIGAVGEAGHPTIPVRERPSAGNQGHDAPERSRVPLQLGDPWRERRAEAAEPRPCAARGEVRDERLDEVDHGAAHVVLGRRAGCPPSGWPDRAGAALGHAIRSRSSARTW